MALAVSASSALRTYALSSVLEQTKGAAFSFLGPIHFSLISTFAVTCFARVVDNSFQSPATAAQFGAYKPLDWPRLRSTSLYFSRRRCAVKPFHKLIRSMTQGPNQVAPSDELLNWPKQDKRRFLHAVYRVGDLDRTIKFYTECFGMKLLRKRDIPDEKYSNAFLGFGLEDSHFVLELTYNYGVDQYEIGTGFGHFGIATQDVYKLVENVKAKGGTVTREPGPVKGGTSVIAFVKDPDGYLFEIIQRGPTPEPLCQVMLRVGDLDRSIKFYEKALGMKLLRKTDRPEQKYTIAMLGYGEEQETTVLELTYNYGITEYTKGNAYAQVAISTDDVYKSAEVINLVIQELGGKITRQAGPIPGINTKITSFLDPDGWKTVLVDNADFLKELEG